MKPLKTHTFKIKDYDNQPAGVMIIEETEDSFMMKQRRLISNSVIVTKLRSLPKPSNSWHDAYHAVECYEMENEFTMTDADGLEPIDWRLTTSS